MDNSDLINITLLILFLILSAFFSASETAFIGLQRVRMIHLVKTRISGAQKVLDMSLDYERFLSTVLLGNNLVNTAVAALGTALVIKWMGNRNMSILVSTIAVTILLLLFSELLPKGFAARNSEKVAFFVVRPLHLVEIVLFPFTKSLQHLMRLIPRISGGTSTHALVSEQEIRSLISLGKDEGVVDIEEADMLENIFHFGDLRVSEIMTPRPELIWIEKDTTLSGFLKIYDQTPHTRFPVFQDTVDNVIGHLSVKDIMQALSKGRLRNTDSVTNLLRTVNFVPESKGAGALFSEIRTKGTSLLMVVDEYGGIAGLITLKQLLEVIVGPVVEDGDTSEKAFVTVDKITFLVDPSISVSDASDLLSTTFPEGNYQTLSGFILEQLGRIPEEGDDLDYETLRISIIEMSGVKIKKIQAKIIAGITEPDKH